MSLGHKLLFLGSVNLQGCLAEISTATESTVSYKCRKLKVKEEVAGRSGGCKDLAPSVNRDARGEREQNIRFSFVVQRGVQCDRSASMDSAALLKCCATVFVFCSFPF